MRDLHQGVMEILDINVDDHMELNTVRNSEDINISNALFLNEFLENYKDYLIVDGIDNLAYVAYVIYPDVKIFIISYFANPFDSFHTYQILFDMNDATKAVEAKLKYFSS